MVGEENGRFDPQLAYYSFWENLYYDDITCNGDIHHAYMLRIFEHAREHMLSTKYLAHLHDAFGIMFVAVKTDQKHIISLPAKEAIKLGSLMNVRTTIEVEGKFRVRFVHELYIFPNGYSVASNDSSSGIKICSGNVDMVVVNAKTHAVSELPPNFFDETHVRKVEPEKLPLVRRPKMDEEIKKKLSKLESIPWKPQAFDTDFTDVVYQAKYLQYYEVARNIHLSSVMTIPMPQTAEIQVLKADVKFKEPVRVTDDIKIRLTNFAIQTKFKIYLEQEMVHSITGKVVNQCVLELVTVDKQSQRLAPLLSRTPNN